MVVVDFDVRDADEELLRSARVPDPIEDPVDREHDDPRVRGGAHERVRLGSPASLGCVPRSDMVAVGRRGRGTVHSVCVCVCV